LTDQRQAPDIYVFVLLRMVMLFFHADTSSSATTDVCHNRVERIDRMCWEARKIMIVINISLIILLKRQRIRLLRMGLTLTMVSMGTGLLT